jgi:hypothetical protein
LRRPSDLPAVEATISASLGAASRIIYLRADVCREDLLVEIEAVG